MSTVGQRFAAARKALVGVFSESSAREAHGMFAGIFPGAVGEPPRRGAKERIAAYADMPWLRAVAEKVATSFASVEWQLKVVRREGKSKAVRYATAQQASYVERRAILKRLAARQELVDVEEHPMLDLLRGGNTFMTGLAMRKVTALHYDLEGEAFWLKERDGLGVPVGAWPLPPDWVLATPTPTTRAFRVGFRGWHGMIPDTEVLWICNHNPSNPYGRGAGLARALADELETDEMAAKFSRQVFFNQARPDFIVFPKSAQGWSAAERDRLEQGWRASHEGFWRAFKARFSSQELGVFEFGQTDFRHLQMIQLREFERNTVIQVFGVPPELMGIIENSNRATATAADFLFSRWVLVPRLEAFRAVLQEMLVPEYDDRLIVDYVSPVQDDGEYALKLLEVAPWSFDVDEARGLRGADPLPDGRGAGVYPIPLGMSFSSVLDAALTPAESGVPALAVPALAPPPTAALDLGELKRDELVTLAHLASAQIGSEAQRTTAAIDALTAAVAEGNARPPARAPDVHVTVAPAAVTVEAPRPVRRRYVRDERGLITEAVDEPVT